MTTYLDTPPAQNGDMETTTQTAPAPKQRRQKQAEKPVKRGAFDNDYPKKAKADGLARCDQEIARLKAELAAAERTREKIESWQS